MCTTSGIDSDLALAIGAGLGGGLGGSLLNLLFADIVHSVHQFDDHKQHNSNDKEVDDGHNQGTIVERHIVNSEMQGAEILLEDDADQGRNQVGNQGIDDGFESSTDHDTDGHVDNIAAIDKGSELS